PADGQVAEAGQFVVELVGGQPVALRDVLLVAGRLEADGAFFGRCWGGRIRPLEGGGHQASAHDGQGQRTHRDPPPDLLERTGRHAIDSKAAGRTGARGYFAAPGHYAVDLSSNDRGRSGWHARSLRRAGRPNRRPHAPREVFPHAEREAYDGGPLTRSVRPTI